MMCMLFVELIFHPGVRKNPPAPGYRPDVVFAGKTDYWGMTFRDFVFTEFGDPFPAEAYFTFRDSHCGEIAPGDAFRIMEGAREVGTGIVHTIRLCENTEQSI